VTEIEATVEQVLSADDLWEDEGDDFDFKDAAADADPLRAGELEYEGQRYWFEIRQVALPSEYSQGNYDEVVFWNKTEDRFAGTFQLTTLLRGGYVGSQDLPFEVTYDLRKWLKANGYPIPFEMDERGHIVRFIGEAIPDDEPDFDFKDAAADAPAEPEEITLQQMKEAEPGFFSWANKRWFGTKKIYHYGRFLVLKNVRARGYSPARARRTRPRACCFTGLTPRIWPTPRT
jgi:hypothetical protein